MANELEYKKHFEDFLDKTQDERLRAETRRDYRDLKQWSTDEAKKLQERNQAPIVFDQFGKKVDAFCGLEINQRTDPKALPRTPKHEKAADVVTEALRFIADNVHFNETSSEIFEDKIVEGYGAAIIEVDADSMEVEVNQIHWDRFYYDPHSRKKDFSDAKYMGITLWMDKEDAIKKFPKKEAEINRLGHGSGDDGVTFDDRPSDWVDRKRDRVRINQEYYKDADGWKEIFYTSHVVLDGPNPSPYVDQDGDPICPIEAQCDYVDRDNARYGYTQRLIDPQDEINHRRSKALYMLSAASLIMEKGALGDQTREEVLEELRKAQGIIELVPGTQFEINRNAEMGNSQLAFYQDAQQAMDSVGINPELSGSTDQAISGRAFIARQQGGMTETLRIFSRHSNWKKRVFRQMWLRVQQFWDTEKWVRVTDDENSIQWVGLNVPINGAEAQLEQQSGKTIDELRAINKEAVDQFIAQSIQQNPALGEVVEVRNNVAELEVDIMIEEVPDTLTLQQEQFETLASLASAGVPPNMFKALLSLSTMPNKDKIMDMLEGDNEAQQQAAAQQMQLAQAREQAEIQEITSNTAKNMASAQKDTADISLKAAQTKDELASAIERIGKASVVGLGI